MPQAPADAKRRIRPRIILLWILLPLLLILLAGYLALPYVAARVLEQWLSDQGLSTPRIEFSHPRWNRLDIPRLTLVHQSRERRVSLQAEQVSVLFDPLQLYASLRIDELRIPRLQLQIDAEANLEQRIEEASDTGIDLNAFAPGQLFGLAPSQRLLIGELQLDYRAPQQAPIHISGSLELTATQLQSRLALQLHTLEQGTPPTKTSATKTSATTADTETSATAEPATEDASTHPTGAPAYLDLYFDAAQNLRLHLSREQQSLLNLNGALDTGLSSDIDSALKDRDVDNTNPAAATGYWQLQLDGKLAIAPLQLWLTPLLPPGLPELNGEQALQLTLSWPSRLPPSTAALWPTLRGTLQSRGSLSLPPSLLPTQLQLQPLSEQSTLTLQLENANLRLGMQLPTLQARYNGVDLPSFSLNTEAESSLDGGSVSGQSRLQLQAPAAEFSADWHWHNEQLQLQWRSNALSLPALQTPLRRLLPALALSLPAPLALKAGQLTLNGDLSAGRAPLQSTTRLQLQQGALAWSDSVSVQGLNSTLTLQQQTDGALSAGGRFDVAQIDAGLPLTLAAVEFGYRQPARGSASLTLSPLRLALLGGTLSLPSLTIDPQQPHFNTVLQLQDIALGEILALYQQPGLNGEIRLQGSLPLQLRDGYLSVRDGVLQNSGPGWLRYQANAAVQQSAAANAGLRLALDALTNLQVSQLQVGVDYAASGELELSCRFQGQNPDWQQGRPIDLTLNLQENLPALLRSLQLAGRISDSVQQKLTR